VIWQGNRGKIGEIINKIGENRECIDTVFTPVGSTGLTGLVGRTVSFIINSIQISCINIIQ